MIKALLVVICALICLGEAATLSKWIEDYNKSFDAWGVYASDPSLIKVNNSFYRMFYTCYDPPYGQYPGGTAQICQATSTTGDVTTFHWVESYGGHNQSNYVVPGIAIQSRDGQWDENLEVAFGLTDPSITTKIGKNATYLLYYSGYSNTSSRGVLGYPANLGLTYSSDGVTFQRYSNAPIMRCTPGWYDSDAVYSVTLLFDPADHNRILMIYVGHCYWNCTNTPGVTLLGAYSTDFVTWTKIQQPIINVTAFNYAWMKDGIAEPGWIYGPDKYYYLFITGNIGDDSKKQIFLARSLSPFSGYTVYKDPIITANDPIAINGVMAPYVLLENQTVRMWMLVNPIDQPAPNSHWFQVSLANSTWPLVVDGTTSTSSSTLSSSSSSSSPSSSSPSSSTTKQSASTNGGASSSATSSATPAGVSSTTTTSQPSSASPLTYAGAFMCLSSLLCLNFV